MARKDIAKFSALACAAALLSSTALWATPKVERFGGTGMQLGQVREGTVLVALVPGGPAEQAGLLPGDLMLSCDGVDLRGVGPTEAAESLRGEAGTDFSLEISRGGVEMGLQLSRRALVTRVSGWQEAGLDADDRVDQARARSLLSAEPAAALFVDGQLLGSEPVAAPGGSGWLVSVASADQSEQDAQRMPDLSRPLRVKINGKVLN